MPTLETNGISLHYEVLGERNKPPVMLIAGLGGGGQSFGAQIKRFAERYCVILPDHRGTGQSSRPADGYTIANHAGDMAALIDHLGVGPTHIVGSSTGGCIAIDMALDHPQSVRSAVLSSSFAHMDDYMIRQFTLRRKLMAEADAKTAHGAAAMFLFSPRYASAHADYVAAWIDRIAALPFEREVSLKRIDMIMRYDSLERLGGIKSPVLVICGDQDLCTPLHMSEELARSIPGAKLTVLEGGGHFIYVEQEQRFFDAVSAFIDAH